MGSNRRNLKAFVRYDGSGRVIPGGPILSAKKPKVGNWKEINAYQCCNPEPPQPVQALRLTFDSIENANLLVGDVSSVGDWNTFFDLPTYGNPFTSVEVVGNEVRLFGGSNIELYGTFFENENLIEVNDLAECIVKISDDTFSNCTNLISVSLQGCILVEYLSEYGPFENSQLLTTLNLPKLQEIFNDVGSVFINTAITSLYLPMLTTAGENNTFSGMYNLTSVNLPLCTNIGNGGFANCYSLTTINIPSCINLGSTVGDNSVFLGITGNNITLTVPNALMTCNVGNPDGDIQYLQANNTITIITV